MVGDLGAADRDQVVRLVALERAGAAVEAFAGELDRPVAILRLAVAEQRRQSQADFGRPNLAGTLLPIYISRGDLTPPSHNLR